MSFDGYGVRLKLLLKLIIGVILFVVVTIGMCRHYVEVHWPAIVAGQIEDAILRDCGFPYEVHQGISEHPLWTTSLPIEGDKLLMIVCRLDGRLSNGSEGWECQCSNDGTPSR